jgi:2-polyprenyl-6-methoxyphenol hydroxylase-like FAD-dependent oxidoreductase
MPDMTESDVLIVGAGPVGLTLAIDLAWRGIDVTVVETRAPAAPPEPKCNHVAARTMEIFRRLGLAEKVRNAGLPADYPHDISYRTTFTGKELTRIPIPCRRDRFTAKDGPDCNWPTPEPPHRINQIFLEPILFEHAAAQPRIRIINRTSVEDGGAGNLGERELARSRHRDGQALLLPLSDRLRRRALGRPQGDRRRIERRRHRAAGAVDLYPRPRSDRSSGLRARLGHRRHQSAPQRHGVCDRRPRAMAAA